ncbi:MAG: radical SAM family heme chaperone HemW [Rudaea sp.]
MDLERTANKGNRPDGLSSGAAVARRQPEPANTSRDAVNSEAQFAGSSDSIAVYIGIPFCKTICTYCDFNVYAHLGKLFDAYVDAVKIELEIAAGAAPTPLQMRSLAFGGGTPSILPAALLVSLVEAACSHFITVPGGEVTLEANPGTVNPEKLVALKQVGVNRLSLGVQTFDDARLKAFNRRHTAEESREAFEIARRAGFSNINVDLIFGLPEQTLQQWEETIDRALGWAPEHLSLYGLQVEEGTALHRQIARGRVPQPDPDLAADMYLLAEDKLSAAGFLHYEISNYARPGFESRHNLTYWLNQPYLGFGAGAHSYFRGERYSNLKSPTDYIGLLHEHRSVVDTRELISRDLEIGETMMLGLRLERGIAFDQFQARFGLDARDKFGGTIGQLVEWGLMQTDEERMRLTTRGRLISNQVLWRFLPDEVPVE